MSSFIHSDWVSNGKSLPRHRSTLQVIRTMACEYALCSLFVPGDRQIILGTKVTRMHTLTYTKLL